LSTVNISSQTVVIVLFHIFGYLNITTAKEVNHIIESPKKKPKQSKGSFGVAVKTEVKEDGKKAPSFHYDEDELLSEAWFSTTDNCVGRTHFGWMFTQGMEDFRRNQSYMKQSSQGHGISWRIYFFDKFKYKSTFSTGTTRMEPRPILQVLKAPCQASCIAHQLEQGKQFPFSLCVPILHKIPTFDPMTIEVVDVSDKTEKVSSPAVESVKGSKLQRQMGFKQAKIMEKKEDSIMFSVTSIPTVFNKLLQPTIWKEAFEEFLALGK
jgi:hypothetical protein